MSSTFRLCDQNKVPQLQTFASYVFPLNMLLNQVHAMWLALTWFHFVWMSICVCVCLPRVY